MKKTISNIRTLAALLMAGAAFAACSSDDDIVNEQPANTGKQSYTLTVSASKDGSTTRALDLDGDAVVASWETTDEIVVTKANGTIVGTLSPTNININGLEATFSGTISGDADINVNDVLTLIYHPIPGGLNGFALQDGTLKGTVFSAENFDAAAATVTISEISGKNIIVSESSANFVNQTAVVVLSPYNSAWSGYHSLNSLTVSVTMDDIPEVGTVTEKIGPITVTGDQPHYFSLPSQSLLAEVLAAKYSLSASAVSTLLASATVTFTGHQTDDDYDREYLTCSKTGYKFAAGKYYKLDNSNFSMTMLYKRAAAGKYVYVENSNISWSHTVTFAVNKEIGWKVVGDNVFCGDKQLYVVDNSGPEPSEGWVKASDSHISFGATYTLEDPAPATPDVTWVLSEMSSIGTIYLQDGLTYKGVTLSGTTGAADFASQRNIIANNGATFTAPSGKKFTSIVVSGTYARFEGDGWTVNDGTTCSTWTGSAESVAFTGQSYMMTTIEFYLDSPLDPAPAPSYTMAADAASGDVGKLICTDGHIHAYGEDAECTATLVAKIIYVGTYTDNTTYTHGLALALADESQSNWSTAVSTCAAKNTSTPVAGASWMLPSRPQWEAMGATEGSSTKATLRDGFFNVGGTNMQENVYWSSTEADDTRYVYYYWFGDDYDLYWMECGKNEPSGIDTRACLVF